MSDYSDLGFQPSKPHADLGFVPSVAPTNPHADLGFQPATKASLPHIDTSDFATAPDINPSVISSPVSAHAGRPGLGDRAISQVQDQAAQLVGNTVMTPASLGQNVINQVRPGPLPSKPPLGFRVANFFVGDEPTDVAWRHLNEDVAKETATGGPLAAALPQPRTDRAAEGRAAIRSVIGPSPESLPPAQTAAEKYLVDLPANVIGTGAQIAVQRKMLPESIPKTGPIGEAAAWEMQNQAAGGEPGHGAAMGGTVGVMGKAFPEAPIKSAVAEGALFGGTTYAETGDVQQSLVNAALPAVMKGKEIVGGMRGKSAAAEPHADLGSQPEQPHADLGFVPNEPRPLPEQKPIAPQHNPAELATALREMADRVEGRKPEASNVNPRPTNEVGNVANGAGGQEPARDAGRGADVASNVRPVEPSVENLVGQQGPSAGNLTGEVAGKEQGGITPSAPAADVKAIPLPPLHSDVHPSIVQDAWNKVSAENPELAAGVKRIEPLDNYKYPQANASVTPETGVLRVNLDKPLTPETLRHELEHIAQHQRGEAKYPGDFNTEEAFDQAVESPARAKSLPAPLAQPQGESPNAPENTGEMFPRLSGGRHAGAIVTPDLSPLVDKIGEMKIGERAKDLSRGVRDFFSIDPIPALKRAGAHDAAWEHATAREAVPHMVNDMLSKVFPESYKDPETMAKTVDIINKDNILGGYDAFQNRAKELRAEAKKKNLFGDTPGEDALEREAQKAEDSAFAIAEKHDIPILERDVKAASPQVRQAIARWRQHVNPELDRLYNEMKRVDPDTERDSRGRVFGARINLLHQGEEGLWAEKIGEEPKPIPGTPGRANIHTNPNVKRDQFDRAAKFTGNYSTDPKAVLENVLGPRWNEVTKLRFYQSLQDRGVAKLVEAGGAKPEMIQGKPAKWITVEVPTTDPKTGKTTNSKAGLVVRADLAGEIHQILDTSQRLPTNPIFKMLTGLQLAQVADAATHAKNIHSVVANAQGAGSVWKDVVRKVPFVGTVDFAKRVFDVTREVSADTPEIRAEIAEMAKKGLVRPHYPATGLQKITKMQDFLHRVDTGSRVIMNRFFDNLVERGLAKDTPSNRRQFVSQVGVYNRRLMGPAARFARDYGLSPFVVAGRNFNRMGRRALTGGTGFEATNGGVLRARMIQAAGPALAFTVPMMLNAITTGKPGGRSGTPLGAWDLGTDNEDGSHKVWDLLNLVGMRRGLRSVGAEAVVEGLRQGKDLNTISGNAITDIMQSAAHPWVGPGAGFAVAAATGRRADIRGKMEAQKIPEGGGKQYLENARAALQSQNPLLYSAMRPLFQQAGLDKTPDGESGYAKNVGSTLMKSPLSAVGIKDVRPGTTAAEDLASQMIGNRMGEGMTPESAERAVVNRDLTNKLRSNPETGRKAIDDAIDAGTISDKQAAIIAKKAGMSPLQWHVRQLSAEDAAKVYKAGNADEKKLLADQVRDKIINSEFPYQEQDKLLKDLDIAKPANLDTKRELTQLRRDRNDAAKNHRPFPQSPRLRMLERMEQLQKGPKPPR